MKITIKLYRVTTVPTEALAVAAGLSHETVDPQRIETALRDKYSPLAPRLVIFWHSFTTSKTAVGMEALAFSLAEAKVPCAGLAQVDPMESVDVNRMDGALEGELNRMGIYTEFENMEWRCSYDIQGN